MLVKLALLAAAGAVGTLARFGVSTWVQRSGASSFPLGTLAVNLLGCFAFGVLWAVAERRVESAEALRMYALTGFMGAFTTFSTFAFDSSVMLARREGWLLAANLALQNGLGIGLVIVGLWLGRKL
ncbi:MAG: CrcB family protein [Planctomycetes bacterium]|nr:CrcB family protein [Planctomycetota bacterium]